MVREIRPPGRGVGMRAHVKPIYPGPHRQESTEHYSGEAGAVSVSPRGMMDVLGRIALAATSAYAFSVGFKVHEGVGVGWAAIEALVYAAALGFLVSAFVVTNGWSRRLQGIVGVTLAMAIAISVAYEITVLHPGYGTDVLAFAHAGAEILIDGDNPYQASAGQVAEAAKRFGVSLTRTAQGGEIDWLISYPALHTLSYSAFIGLGFSDLRWGTLIVELAALGVIWGALSPMGRVVVPLLLLVEPYLTVVFTGGGVTDWLWVLPVAISAITLQRERFGYAGLFLGLACAVKQHPWFAVPFVVVWVVRTVIGAKGMPAKESIGAFFAGLVAGFVIPNLPFFIWSPSAWTRGVLSPALGNLVPDGHGLSSLLSEGLLELPPWAYSILIAATLAGLLAVYARFFGRMREALWVLSAVAMYVSYRSLHSYFVFWLPIAALWIDLRFVSRPLRDCGLLPPANQGGG